MRIDTNQLRESAYNERMHGNWAFAQGIEMCIQELDRLYALEDATTPFASRADVETAIKGHGWERSKPDDFGDVLFKKDGGRLWVGDNYSFNVRVHIAALTPALLDKILEAK